MVLGLAQHLYSRPHGHITEMWDLKKNPEILIDLKICLELNNVLNIGG